MNQFKSIQLIKSIPDTNLPFLREFVSKNNSESVYELFEFALKSNFENRSNQEIWTAIYPNEKYNKQQFANYCHQLLNKVEQAICLISLKEKSLNYYDLLLPNLLEWDILHHYQFSHKKAEKTLQSANGYDDYSFYKHRLDYFEFIRLEKESSRKVDLNITAASQSLDEYYVLLKLRYLCAALSHQSIATVQYKVDIITALLPLIESSDLIDVPLIKNYLLIYNLLTHPEEEARFLELKKQLTINRDKFSASELNEIYIYPINFCIQKINNGQLIYRQELLDIYKSLPSFNVSSDEIISPWRFRNVVHLALMQKDFDWAESFINKFSHRLLDEYRDNAVNYNLANLKFHQKQYDAVIPLLIHVEYQDINYALICKILLLKSYFEMDEFEAFHSLLESFRLFVMRNKDMTASQRKKYLDLLSIMRKLAKLDYASKEVIEKFKSKIKAKEIVADKPWILDQLERF